LIDRFAIVLRTRFNHLFRLRAFNHLVYNCLTSLYSQSVDHAYGALLDRLTVHCLEVNEGEAIALAMV